MAEWEDELAFRHAPVILQQVHRDSIRSDFITKVDFAHPWDDVWKNWDAVNPTDGAKPRFRCLAHVYYSVVETPSHYFILYGLYHPQDWLPLWGKPSGREPGPLDEHKHDMEGCLAVVPRKPDDAKAEFCAALFTVAHFNFAKYAGWQKDNGTLVPAPCWPHTQQPGQPVLDTRRFASESGEPERRFKIYVDACGHAIRGSRRGWGTEALVVRYRPSREVAEEPTADGFVQESDEQLRIQTVGYRLVNVFEQDGLWQQRGNPRVFQWTRDPVRQAFAIRQDGGGFAPGSANPPWAWKDDADWLPPGVMATDPARLTAFYFYSRDPVLDHTYLHNPYLGVVKQAAPDAAKVTATTPAEVIPPSTSAAPAMRKPRVKRGSGREEVTPQRGAGRGGKVASAKRAGKPRPKKPE